MQSGITDIDTAKVVAKKLFQTYTKNNQMAKQDSQKMLIDTYKLMNKQFRPTEQDMSLYNNILDFNGDGKISIEDLQSLAIKLLSKVEIKKYTRNVHDRLQVAKRLFQKFDTDKSGFLSQQEIPALLIQTYSMMGISFNPTKEDIDSWMEMTDLDGDGKVNLVDYERLIITSLQKCGIRIYQKD